MVSTGIPLIDKILFARTITSFLIVTCSAIWIYVNQYLVPVENVSFNYNSIVQGKEWWRLVSSAFSHYSILHLLFNMASLWGYGYMEELLGKVVYLKYSFILLIVSFLLCLLVYKIFIDVWRNERYREVHAIGYSCVVFGWMTLGALAFPDAKITLFGFDIPMVVIPFMSLALTQLIIPNASFVGHASGIVAAFMIRFYVFFWFHDYLFFVVGPLFAALMAFNYYKTKIQAPSISSNASDTSSRLASVREWFARYFRRNENNTGQSATSFAGEGRRLGSGQVESTTDLEMGSVETMPSEELPTVRVDRSRLLQPVQAAAPVVDDNHTQVILPPEEEADEILARRKEQQRQQQAV